MQIKEVLQPKQVIISVNETNPLIFFDDVWLLNAREYFKIARKFIIYCVIFCSAFDNPLS
jgi:hypothetical protein